MNGKTHLLSTVALAQPLIKKAEENGVELDSLPFIQVNDIDDSVLSAKIEKLCTQSVTVVFTSVSAINAISRLIYIAKPDWEIYCIGNATKNALLDYFHLSAIKGVANDAATLAQTILMDGINEVVFFCGDKRMDTLTGILRNYQVWVQEMVVYRTVETPSVVTKEYDGVLFFSPSAVNSFFSVNKIATGTVLFAIGNTTAGTIKEMSGNKLIISATPSKEQLVDLAIQYFHKQASIAHKD